LVIIALSKIDANYSERGKAATSPCAIHGKPTVRQADGGAVVRGWKKQRSSCNVMDRI